MVSNNTSISRRDVLKANGAFAAIGLAGARSDGTVEVNVGFSRRRGRRVAITAASDVVREFAFNALAIRVSENAIPGLRRRPDIRSEAFGEAPPEPVNFEGTGTEPTPNKKHGTRWHESLRDPPSHNAFDVTLEDAGSVTV